MKYLGRNSPDRLSLHCSLGRVANPGNPVTPVPVSLDGATHTLMPSPEGVAADVPPGSTYAYRGRSIHAGAHPKIKRGRFTARLRLPGAQTEPSAVKRQGGQRWH